MRRPRIRISPSRSFSFLALAAMLLGLPGPAVHADEARPTTLYKAETPTTQTTAPTPALRARAPILRASGPAPSRPAPVATESLLDEGSVYRLRPLDPVLITLRGIPSPETIEEQIDENGNVNLPYIGPITAAGRTTSELEEAVEFAYVQGQIYRRITVNVVAGGQSYYVRGEVKQPGRYPLHSGVTLVQAIATAGGFTEFASPKRTKVIRGGKTLVRNLPELEQHPEKDEPVEAGDVLVVPRSVF